MSGGSLPVSAREKQNNPNNKRRYATPFTGRIPPFAVQEKGRDALLRAGAHPVGDRLPGRAALSAFFEKGGRKSAAV